MLCKYSLANVKYCRLQPSKKILLCNIYSVGQSQVMDIIWMTSSQLIISIISRQLSTRTSQQSSDVVLEGAQHLSRVPSLDNFVLEQFCIMNEFSFLTFSHFTRCLKTFTFLYCPSILRQDSQDRVWNSYRVRLTLPWNSFLLSVLRQSSRGKARNSHWVWLTRP